MLDEFAVLEAFAVKVVAGPSLRDTSTLFCAALMNTGGIILGARELTTGTPAVAFGGVARVGKAGEFGGWLGRATGGVGPELHEVLAAGAVCERCIGPPVEEDEDAETASELDDELGGVSETASHSAIWLRAWRPPSWATTACICECASAMALATMRTWSEVSEGADCVFTASCLRASSERPRLLARDAKVWRRGARMGPRIGIPPSSPPRVSNKPPRARSS